MYKPSELHLFLSELGISPKKSLSQNFLIDGNIVRKIISIARIQPQDLILEIGPGPGSLTQALLEAGAQVVAVEKDKALATALQRLQTPNHQLEIFNEDILTFSLEKIAQRLKGQDQSKVIANLPYHLTTFILTRFILEHRLFSSLIVMVQEEVARRLTAAPGTKDYSSFTVFMHFYTNPHYAFSVSRHCFYPQPQVDSAIIILDLKPPPLTQGEEKQFFNLTRTAFEHRRKMLRASLKTLFDPQSISAALEAIGQNPLARPEDLSLSEFLQFYQILKLNETEH